MQFFRAVEVQQTFYRLPRVETVRRWRAEAPPDFAFTMKAWQTITHPATSPTYRKARLQVAHPERYGFFQLTEEVVQAWQATREVALTLDAWAVVFQCPPSFGPTEANFHRVRGFFTRIPRGPFRLVWEPRAWPLDVAADLCRELDLTLALDPLEHAPPAGVPVYYRLHGRALGRGRYVYNHRYSEAELQRLVALCREHPPQFLFFNNVFMWEDAQRFLALWAATSSPAEGKGGPAP